MNDNAIFRLTRFADGSLRDAESMLDQILCYSENEITLQTIQQIFGLISILSIMFIYLNIISF